MINDSDYSSNSAVLEEKPKFMLKKVRSAIGGGTNNDKHNALIDEFKMAHKRMFKNGFAESPAHPKVDEVRILFLLLLFAIRNIINWLANSIGYK